MFSGQQFTSHLNWIFQTSVASLIKLLRQDSECETENWRFVLRSLALSLSLKSRGNQFTKHVSLGDVWNSWECSKVWIKHLIRGNPAWQLPQNAYMFLKQNRSAFPILVIFHTCINSRIFNVEENTFPKIHQGTFHFSTGACWALLQISRQMCWRIQPEGGRRSW